MSRRYDTVIFDLDGTLLNNTGGSGRWCQGSAEHFGRPVRTLDEVRSVCRQRRAESDGAGSAGRKGSKGFMQSMSGLKPTMPHIQR